jgi:hypothetical protein
MLEVMERLKSLTAILVSFFAVTIIITFPVILHLNDRAIGSLKHPGLEGELFFERNTLHNAKNGSFGRLFKTDLVSYPCGQDISLRVANSLHLYFSLPLTVIFTPLAAYNILVIIILTLNGFMMYLLARDFFQSRIISFCAGLYFMLNSYVLLKISMGFLQKVSLFWLPLYLLCLLRLLDKKRNIYLFGSAIFLFLIKLSYPPYAYYALIFTLALAGYDLINTGGTPLFSKKVFLIIIVFAVSVLLFDFYMIGFRVLSKGHLSFQKILLPLMPYGQIDVSHPLRSMLPAPTNLPFGISLLGVFLGVYAAFLKKGLPRFFLVVVVACFVISAGPYLMINGKPWAIFNQKVILPYYFLYKYTPSVYGEGLILPIRIFPILNICLAMLIGYALTIIAQKVSSKGAVIAASLFILIYLLENLVLFPELFPVRSSELKVAEFYRQIRDEKFEAILNLPISGKREITNLYCYYATLCNKKIMNAYDDARLCINVPSLFDGAAIKKKFIQQLTKWDVRYIVIHKNLFEDVDTTSSSRDLEWLIDFCGAPVNYENDKLLVYRIPNKE